MRTECLGIGSHVLANLKRAGRVSHSGCGTLRTAALGSKSDIKGALPGLLARLQTRCATEMDIMQPL